MRTTPVTRGVRRGFTLVEMLVVITIIGILAGLAIPAVIVARNRAKITAVSMDIKQLEMACQNYKEKFGEYPPDFTFVGNAFLQPGVQSGAQQAVLRHLAKAFPRYTPGLAGNCDNPATPWGGFKYDLVLVGILPQNPTNGDVARLLSPQTALTFWLGGVPDPNNSFLPSGFGADPAHPFSLPTAYGAAPVCANRIGPFFDFDSTRLRNANQAAGTPINSPCSWLYWPQGADGDHSTGAITYFRAENGIYQILSNIGRPTTKSQQDVGDTANPTVFPAYDTRTSNLAAGTVTWINPRSVQILSAGLDTRFGAIPVGGTPGLAFPTGENYQPFTYDDITNFSGGKLEDAIP